MEEESVAAVAALTSVLLVNLLDIGFFSSKAGECTVDLASNVGSRLSNNILTMSPALTRSAEEAY